MEIAGGATPDFPSQAEKALFVDLSCRLWERMQERGVISHGEFSGLYYHDGINSHHKALWGLEQAGLFRRAYPERTMLALDVRETDIPNVLRRHAEELTPALLEGAIEAYIDLFTEFPNDRYPEVPVTRRPFEIPEIYVSTFQLLESCGYVMTTAEGTVWADRMIPIMMRIGGGLWSKDGICYFDEPCD
ncbi:hypothetical protein [Brucella sp. IR073]|uniref:hypothetical protein n=1 Tax=unclassified Brucella TaxID=2632610 RepID=UPI003B980E63